MLYLVHGDIFNIFFQKVFLLPLRLLPRIPIWEGVLQQCFSPLRCSGISYNWFKKTKTKKPTHKNIHGELIKTIYKRHDKLKPRGTVSVKCSLWGVSDAAALSLFIILSCLFNFNCQTCKYCTYPDQGKLDTWLFCLHP